MTHDVLGGADTAWLHMDEPTNPMVVNGVLELAETLDWPRAYAVVERLAAIPRFRARVVGSLLGRPSWEPSPLFDLMDHVEHVTLDAGGDDALRTFIGRAISGQLDLHRPLWRVYFIDRPGAGTVVLSRIHHSVADGFALLGVLLSLCDHDGAPSIHAHDGLPAAHPPAHASAVLEPAKALARLVTLAPDPHTLLKGPLSVEKRVSWSEPLALSEIKDTAHLLGATVNDVLVATAAGAIGRYLGRHGQRSAELELHAMVPVNLRESMDTAPLGNRFGLVILALPVGVDDPLERVAAVKERMGRLKGTPEAFVTYALLGAMGTAPRPIEDLGVAFFATKASLVLTNVPGPRERLSLAGVPVSRIMFWVPQSGRMGLGISIFSYAGEVTIGILADAALIPDPDALAADLRAEVADLAAQRRTIMDGAGAPPPSGSPASAG